MNYHHSLIFFFFFNDTATTEIYPLSLHDALPILTHVIELAGGEVAAGQTVHGTIDWPRRFEDRKSTRLNSSHGYISYAVFCLKKKKFTALEDGRVVQDAIDMLNHGQTASDAMCCD